MANRRCVLWLRCRLRHAHVLASALVILVAPGVLSAVTRHRGCTRAALREGDVGERGAEATVVPTWPLRIVKFRELQEFFPKTEFQESATSAKIPCEPAIRIGRTVGVMRVSCIFTNALL